MALPQVEDITASHEAALLEMENNHTVTIAILQDDHDHKVQGSCHPRCVWGHASPTFLLQMLEHLLLSVPLSFLPSCPS